MSQQVAILQTQIPWLILPAFQAKTSTVLLLSATMWSRPESRGAVVWQSPAILLLLFSRVEERHHDDWQPLRLGSSSVSVRWRPWQD